MIAESKGKRFRRNTVVEKMVAMRKGGGFLNSTLASEAAEAAITDAAARKLISRQERIFWMAAAPGRTMVDGTPLRELHENVSLKLVTKVPEKWLAVDTETGELWEGTSKGDWTRASAAAAARLKKVAAQTRPS